MLQELLNVLLHVLYTSCVYSYNNYRYGLQRTILYTYLPALSEVGTSSVSLMAAVLLLPSLETPPPRTALFSFFLYRAAANPPPQISTAPSTLGHVTASPNATAPSIALHKHCKYAMPDARAGGNT